jgi:hypothetical protein
MARRALCARRVRRGFNALALLFASTAVATAQSPIHLAIAGGLTAPVGAIAGSMSTGVSLDARLESKPLLRGFGLRAELSDDYIGGRGAAVGDVSSYRAFGASLSIVNHSGLRIYEFVGAGAFSRTILYNISAFGDNNNINDEHEGLGWQAGVGYAPTGLLFVEAAARTTNVRDRNETWLMLKLGFRPF